MTTASEDKGRESDSSDVSADVLLKRLKNALSKHGDFPASAKVVNELRMLTNDPKTRSNQVAEVILREPSLGTRVLHVVNSSFYRRAKQIMTVSQAVIQIGMRPLSELCSGLILLQKFVPAARREGPFASCLQKTIVTSLVASSITSETTGGTSATKNEQGYLAGSFSELGTLLLAFYFPNIYSNAVKRAKGKDISIEQSIQEITGLSPLEISSEVVAALDLPQYYREVISDTIKISRGQKVAEDSQALSMARNIYAAQEISHCVVNNKGKKELDQVIAKLSSRFSLPSQVLCSSLGKLPEMFQDHCAAIEINLPEIPTFVSTYDGQEAAGGSDTEAEPAVDNAFQDFLEEIREAVEQRESTASIITSVMETLAWNLNFDRVLLMLLDSRKLKLVGRMAIGAAKDFNAREFTRPIGGQAARYAPDAAALAESRAVFNGDPLLENGWPIAVIPIGFEDRAIGIIYADKVDSDQDEVVSHHQVAISILAELIDRSIKLNSDPGRTL